MMKTCKTLVIGGGIVGMATAARLARCGVDVVLLEKDEQASCCAMNCVATLGDPLCTPNADVRALASASAEMLCKVPGAIRDKQAVHLFGGAHLARCMDMFACCVVSGASTVALGQADLACCYPYVQADEEHWVAALCLQAQAIDADALYRYFRNQFVKSGGELCFGEALEEGCFGGGAWTVKTTSRKIRAEVIVNCAGALADDVARRCDARRLRLMTLKRTCLELSVEPNCAAPAGDGPLICWEGDSIDLYCDFRSAGRVLLSYADDERARVCDAEPDSKEIGTAIVCFEERTSLRLVTDSGPARACLQSFAADCRPVIGWAREAPGFFWCAAMGDFGVACATAASAIASDMVQNRSDFSELVDRCEIRKECLCPDRLGFVGVVG